MTHARLQRARRLGSRLASRLLAPLAIVALAGGCSESDVPRLGDYLDELQVEGARDNAVYIPLGKFRVSMQARPDESAHAKPMWVRVTFRLYAETSPANASNVKSIVTAAKRDLRDGVITAIRSSTADDLADPRLASLKARMSDAVRRQLGDDQFRQLVCKNLVTEGI